MSPIAAQRRSEGRLSPYKIPSGTQQFAANAVNGNVMGWVGPDPIEGSKRNHHYLRLSDLLTNSLI
jgi:hypothetical protein